MTSRAQVRDKVQRVLYRTLGLPDRPAAPARRRLVTEQELRDLPFGSDFAVPADALITPLARQVALDRHVTFLPARAEASAHVTPGAPRSALSGGPRRVALGADHGGFPLKENLRGYLQELGHEVIDCGTNGPEAVDYPDFALAVAELVSQGGAYRGILVDGAGIGSCMAANKVPGVRAAMCYDQSSAVNSREHNDANVLTLGAGLIGVSLARQIVKTWLETDFGGGRHMRRVEKIAQIERRFLRKA